MVGAQKESAPPLNCAKSGLLVSWISFRRPRASSAIAEPTSVIRSGFQEDDIAKPVGKEDTGVPLFIQLKP